MKRTWVPPGDDVCPTPAPVTESPPFDRFCDLVLTGGVASGVVYPWAIVELARAYRFRSIGGTSVGAMAATLAAAAEYGRRHGVDDAFEPLRLTPGALAQTLPDGRTRMLSLFQANAQGKRLLALWATLGRGKPEAARLRWWQTGWVRIILQVGRAYGRRLAVGFLLGLLIAVALGWSVGWALPSVVLAILLAPLGAALAVSLALWDEVRRGVIDNGLGLCKGATLEEPVDDDGRPGLVEWLHDGIQRSAGLKTTDPPLTFRDLWNAPRHPGATPRRCSESDPPGERSIDLQIITTNVTHGRPYRLPHGDRMSRLFFRVEELESYLPKPVLDALVASSRPYDRRDTKEQFSDSDPPPGPRTAGFLELPYADLPLVVAARLSLSFPLLFSAVPLWAVDYEAPKPERGLQRCQFTDGGASSNFPIHLFDAALPRWPTFGLWLDRRPPKPRKADEQDVWLPLWNGEGWGDGWNRFDPEAAGRGTDTSTVPNRTTRAGFLFGFLAAIVQGAVDWRDRTSFRLPHVRNRIARVLLRPGEGGLNIGMPRWQILEMAHRYGTRAGRLFIERFVDVDGEPSRAWREQRWVRLEVLVTGIRERLLGLASSVRSGGYAVSMHEAIDGAVGTPPVANTRGRGKLKPAEAASLQQLLRDLEALESSMRASGPPPFEPVPQPELRLRAPL